MKEQIFRKEEGVSEVLGFLLVMAGVFIIFSAFMNTVVPNMVSSAEAQHYQQLIGEVYSMKSTLMNALSLRIYPNQLYISLNLGTQSFPIFVPPTEGGVTISPFSPANNYFNVSIPTSSGTQVVSTGFSVYISLYNHVYPAQEIIFDNGVIATGHLNAPVTSLSVISNGTASITGSSLTLVLFNCIGGGSSYTSAGGAGISVLVTSISSNTYSSTGPVTIKVNSPLAKFWASYIRSLAPSSVQVSQSGSAYMITVNGMTSVTVILMTLTASISGVG
ncbi:MAG: hypothetical protein ACP5GL_07785 [Infirmifilum sp.]